MLISWTAKRQLTFFAIFALIVVIIGFFAWKSVNTPTCFDSKQNQNELGIDCGGPCSPCLGEIRDIIVSWSKTFKLSNGSYEVAALIENPNLFLSAKSLKYKFKLYDDKNILIAIKEGETYINPGEQYVIFHPSIDTGHRIPKSVSIELDNNLKWERVEGFVASFRVVKKEFINDQFPRLVTEIANEDFFPVEDVEAVAVLYGDNGNVMAVSSSRISSIDGNSSRAVVFTWPEVFEKEPSSIEVLLRTMANNN